MVVQSVMLTMFAVAIGVPLGIIAGNGAWFVVADPIGVATDASRAPIAIVGVAVAAVVISVTVALLSSWRSTTTLPAVALRVE